MKNNKLLYASVLAFLALSLCVLIQPAFCQSDGFSSRLQQADASVGHAFTAVLNAETAGANITGLLNQLNVAGDLLAQADNLNRSGDVTGATNALNQVLPITQQVAVQAATAESNAKTEGQNALILTVVFSVVGSILLVLVLLLIWRAFKKRYISRMLESKPEVVDNQSTAE